MLVSKFPDIHWLKRQIHHQFQNKKGPNGVNLPFAGWPTVLLNVTSHQKIAREDIEGPLSLFMNLEGMSTIGTANQQVTIKDNAYIITNNRERYDLILNNQDSTEVFNIHFGTQFLKDACHFSLQNNNYLLDNPEVSDKQEFPHFQLRAAWRCPTFNLLTQQLKQLYTTPDSPNETREIALLALFEYLLLNHQKTSLQVEQLSSLKTSTKEELIKRLYLAVDYIYAFYNHPIQLEKLAQISCLSKYHFLRSFKQAFGMAPYQFIKQVRAQQAINQLQNTSATIQEIAFDIGLENASSLSRMLFKLTGKYPSTYRK